MTKHSEQKKMDAFHSQSDHRLVYADNNVAVAIFLQMSLSLFLYLPVCSRFILSRIGRRQ